MKPADLLDIKVGDQILIVDRWVSGCAQNSSGMMDKYLGQILTISCICTQSEGYFSCCTKEDNGRWLWNHKCITKVIKSYEKEMENFSIDLTAFV